MNTNLHLKSVLFSVWLFCFANEGFIQAADVLYLLLLLSPLCLRPAEQMFREVMRLRREMSVAKLGFYLTDQG